MGKRRRASNGTAGRSSNEYTGYCLRPGETSILELMPGSVDAEEFYRRFVGKRRPVVIRGGLHEPEWEAVSRWVGGDNKNELVDRVGSAEVQVEARAVDGGTPFGRGRRRAMPFDEFMRRLDAGEEGLYLTPQDMPPADDGRPPLCSLPASALVPDFPLRPTLIPGLTPVSVNLWIGRSAEGSSSGLHHDYHDNLYCLLSGTKVFTVYAPSEAAKMYTHGRIARVHPNGRINYVGAPTAADGSDGGGRARQSAEDATAAASRALESAEQAAAVAQGGAAVAAAAARVQSASAALDAALDAAMDAELEDDGEGDQGNDRVHAMANGGAPPEPLSFSRVGDPATADTVSFPLLSSAACAVATLVEGDLLFLPCGWFHEVTSGGGFHAALNYWFAPCDALHAGSALSPYVTDYWARDWTARAADLLRTLPGLTPAALEGGRGAGTGDKAGSEEAAAAASPGAASPWSNARSMFGSGGGGWPPPLAFVRGPLRRLIWSKTGRRWRLVRTRTVKIIPRPVDDDDDDEGEEEDDDDDDDDPDFDANDADRDDGDA